MERWVRITLVSVFAAFAVIFVTGCTTEDQGEAAKEAQSQDTADKTNQKTTDKNSQETTDKNSQETTDKNVQETTDKNVQETNEKDRYRPLMEAVIEAIEKDDAEALYELQESEDAKELALSVRDGEHYIYFPDGEDSQKGIGYYTFAECSCKQWYYGDYKDGQREGAGTWYYVSSSTEDGSLYKEVYDGGWSGDAPNGKGRQLIALGDSVDTDKKFKVKNGLFYGTYKIKDKLEDGTVVRGKYKLKEGRYVTIPDEELEANNFAVPEEPHLAIAFLYNKDGAVKSCSMLYTEDVTRGVKHFY